MNILQRLRTDLQKSVAEHQAMLLASVLRQRFAELTLGDLREILTSPLGRGIDNLKIADLSQGIIQAEPATPAPATPRKVKRAKKAKAAGKATKRRGPGRPPKAKAAEAPAAGGKKGAKKGAKKAAKRQRVTSRDFVGLVFDALRSAGAPMTSGQLRAQLGGSSSTVYRAVTELLKAGKVTVEGKPARYSIAEGAGAERPAAAPAASEGGAPARRPKAANVSARTIEGRAQYDQTVMNVLQGAQGWVGASRLRAEVGGSDNQIRISLHRLIANGQVLRRGERNSTEYRANTRG